MLTLHCLLCNSHADADSLFLHGGHWWLSLNSELSISGSDGSFSRDDSDSVRFESSFAFEGKLKDKSWGICRIKQQKESRATVFDFPSVTLIAVVAENEISLPKNSTWLVVVQRWTVSSRVFPPNKLISHAAWWLICLSWLPSRGRRCLNSAGCQTSETSHLENRCCASRKISSRQRELRQEAVS